jgi:hypothetical protein
MLEEYKAKYGRSYNFSLETDQGVVEIHVIYYDPGTNFFIHSASLEPNDPEEVEYEAFLLDEDGEVIKQVFDDDGVYEPWEVLEVVRKIEKEGDY